MAMDKLVSLKPDDLTPAEEESGYYPTYAQLVSAHSAFLFIPRTKDSNKIFIINFPTHLAVMAY